MVKMMQKRGLGKKKLDNIEWTLLKVLINFLEPFNAATKELEGPIHPMLQNVL